MRLLLFIFISLITIQTSIAETDLTGKTIVCDNFDEHGYKGFINKRFVYGFIDSKQVVKFEYGYHYEMTESHRFERDYLLGGVVTQKIGTYKDYSPNPNNLIFEFDKNVKTVSYKNKYEKAETVLKCKGMTGWVADDKNHCATEILHRQELKLHKNFVSQNGKLDLYAQPQWRTRCVLGADDGFSSLVEVVQENWMNEIKKGREDAQRKIQENKSKNQL
jgi:hypothetical protein